MIVDVTMAHRHNPMALGAAVDYYDLCAIQMKTAAGHETTWRFLDGQWVRVARKMPGLQSVTLDLGGGNVVHLSQASHFTINIGGTSSTGGTGTFTIA